MKKGTQKTGNGKTLLRLLHGSWGFFIACILAGLLFNGCELLVPQVIRVSVDSLLGKEPVHEGLAALPARWSICSICPAASSRRLSPAYWPRTVPLC